MFNNSSNDEPESGVARNAALLRAAIEKEHEEMLRSVVVLVSWTEVHLHGPEVRERAEEIFQMAIVEAMKHAKHFDPTRSARSWVRGIAARLLLNRRRGEARGRRCVPATDLGEGGWATALRQLRGESDDTVVAARLDLAQALSRIPPEDRRVIEVRYYRGLDGEELAGALGVPTPGAARVRVCRAMRALRAQLRPFEGEFLP
jgi:RNA polymerase sigma factor (sigma-70 family)